MRNLFLCAAFILFIPLNAYAKTHVVESIEWKALNSQEIWVGTVENVKRLDVPKPQYGVQWIYEEVMVNGRNLENAETGNSQETFVWRATENDSAQSWKDSGHEIVFFLNADDASGEDILMPIQTKTLRQGTLDAVDLDTALTKYWPVASSNKNLLKDRESILDAISAGIAKKKKNTDIVSEKIELDPEKDKDTYMKFWSGSAVYLVVPKD